MKLIFILVLLAFLCYAGCSAGDKPVAARPTATGAPTSPAKAKISAGPHNFKLPTELQIRSDEDLMVTGPLVVQRIFYEISPDGLSFEQKTESYAAAARPNDPSVPADRPSKYFVLKLEKSLKAGKEHFLKIDSGLTNVLGQKVVAEGTVKFKCVHEEAGELR
ncbi:MAG: hypothetical protein ACJ74T_09405 [Pyrinomonadaceae bacterium]